MKSNVKTIILIILGTIFAYPILINANFSYFGGYNSENLEVDIESKIKRADFWNIAPIEIDNSNPNSNWSKTANENDWCNGNGSLSNPYVIEKVTFNNPTQYGIKIINSKTEYFTIRNVTVYSAYYGGIKLENTNNGTFMNNNFSNNGWIAIYLDNSNANNISGNTLNNNDQGIFLRWSNNNTLSGNTANNNYQGIYLYGSNNNTLSGNTVNNNNIYGIELIESNDNIISGNTANNNEYGISLDFVCEDNTISGNIMNRCGLRISNAPGTFEVLLSNEVDTTNLVNGKPLYYYTNEVNLGVNDFLNAGQVILVNCDDSLISNLNVSYSSMGISLYSCNNNTISGNIANHNYNGIRLDSAGRNTVSGNTANNNEYGIYLTYSQSNDISGNNATNNEYGIYLICSDINDISGNTANNNEYGIYLMDSDENTVSGNTLLGNNVCISEVYCNDNTFENNDCGGGDGIPFELIILISSISGGAVIGVATLLLIIRKRKRIE